MKNQKSILVLRGNLDKIKKSDETLLPGQPLYIMDTNLLCIGGMNGTAVLEAKPITVEKVIKYEDIGSGEFELIFSISENSGKLQITDHNGDISINAGNDNVDLSAGNLLKVFTGTKDTAVIFLDDAVNESDKPYVVIGRSSSSSNFSSTDKAYARIDNEKFQIRFSNEPENDTSFIQLNRQFSAYDLISYISEKDYAKTDDGKPIRLYTSTIIGPERARIASGDTYANINAALKSDYDANPNSWTTTIAADSDFGSYARKDIYLRYPFKSGTFALMSDVDEASNKIALISAGVSKSSAIGTKGNNDVNSASYALSFGIGNKNTNNYSMTFGRNLRTTNAYEIAFGKGNRYYDGTTSNEDRKNQIFSIGTGTITESWRANIFQLDSTGDFELNACLGGLKKSFNNIIKLKNNFNSDNTYNSTDITLSDDVKISNANISGSLVVAENADIAGVSFSHRDSLQQSVLSNGRLKAIDDDTATNGPLKWGQIEPMGFSARYWKNDGEWQQTTVCIDPNRIGILNNVWTKQLTEEETELIGTDTLYLQLPYSWKSGTIEIWLDDYWVIKDIDEQGLPSSEFYMYAVDGLYECVAGLTEAEGYIYLSTPGNYFPNQALNIKATADWLISDVNATKTYSNLDTDDYLTFSITQEDYDKLTYITIYGIHRNDVEVTSIGRYSPKAVVEKEYLVSDAGYEEVFDNINKKVLLSFCVGGFGMDTLDRVEIEYSDAKVYGENYVYLPIVNGHLATEEWAATKISNDISSAKDEIKSLIPTGSNIIKDPTGYLSSKINFLGSEATGEYSFSYGIETKATGARSVAFNHRSIASGERSFAVNYSEASGKHAFSANYGVATGAQSAAFGYATTEGAYQFAVGNKTAANANALFKVGNNKSTNAFEVLVDGRAKILTAPIDANDLANKEYVDSVSTNSLENVSYVLRDSAQTSTISNGRITCGDDDSMDPNQLDPISKWGLVEPMGFSARVWRNGGRVQQTTVCINPDNLPEQDIIGNNDVSYTYQKEPFMSTVIPLPYAISDSSPIDIRVYLESYSDPIYLQCGPDPESEDHNTAIIGGASYDVRALVESLSRIYIAIQSGSPVNITKVEFTYVANKYSEVKENYIYLPSKTGTIALLEDLGDMEIALDNIIAIQNSILGGNS